MEPTLRAYCDDSGYLRSQGRYLRSQETYKSDWNLVIMTWTPHNMEEIRHNCSHITEIANVWPTCKGGPHNVVYKWVLSVDPITGISEEKGRRNEVRTDK